MYPMYWRTTSSGMVKIHPEKDSGYSREWTMAGKVGSCNQLLLQLRG